MKPTRHEHFRVLKKQSSEESKEPNQVTKKRHRELPLPRRRGEAPGTRAGRNICITAQNARVSVCQGQDFKTTRIC